MKRINLPEVGLPPRKNELSGSCSEALLAYWLESTEIRRREELVFETNFMEHDVNEESWHELGIPRRQNRSQLLLLFVC